MRFWEKHDGADLSVRRRSHFTAPLRALSPTGLFTAIIFSYRNVRNFAAFAIHDSDMARGAVWRVFRNLFSNGFALLMRCLVARAIHASQIDKAVAVLHIEKVARRMNNQWDFQVNAGPKDLVPFRNKI